MSVVATESPAAPEGVGVEFAVELEEAVEEDEAGGYGCEVTQGTTKRLRQSEPSPFAQNLEPDGTAVCQICRGLLVQKCEPPPPRTPLPARASHSPLRVRDSISKTAKATCYGRYTA